MLFILFSFGFSRVFILLSPLINTIISERGMNVKEIQRICKNILIYSKYMTHKAVGIGIIGRLGKIFGVGLNFLGCRNDYGR